MPLVEPRRRLTALVLGIALAASACGGGDAVDETAALDAPASDDGANTPASAWPALVAPVAGGGQFDLGDLEGQDVILWFWAPW